MEAETTERRYNTRFRGVPRSVFTYSRSKKTSVKANNENHVRSGIKSDYVYTKLGKKSNQESSSPPKSKNKTQSPLLPVKEKESAKQNSLPNGTHKPCLQEKDHLQEIPESVGAEKTPLVEVDKTHSPKIDKSVTDDVESHAPPLPTEKGAKIEPSLSISPKANKHLSSFKLDQVVSSLKNNKTPKSFTDLIKKAPSLTDKDVPPANDDVAVIAIKSEERSSPLKATSPELSPKMEQDMDGVFFEASEDVLSANNSKSAWIPSKEKLSWNNCNVADYNPKTKMFRCVVCQAVGFMSRIGEHYLGTHCNVKVFHCPQCSYCSAWWRCVRNHLSKTHGVSNVPAAMWKNQPLLDEIMQILQNLKYSVDCEDRVEKIAENFGKRYICPKCPYATDRRDLYNRHENIHREEKPFQCYVCYKLFNRADHVKKHFCRIHKEYNYDINYIRRLPSKRSRIPLSPSLNGGGSMAALQEMTASVGEPSSANQSQLMNYLTGSPTMVKMNREIDNALELSDKESLNDSTNDNTFSKSHSNLLTFLTQNAFSPKPISKKSNEMSPPKDLLHEALLKPQSSYPYRGSQPKSYSCPYCPWTGPNSWALRIHTSTHYKTFCVLCNFKSSEASDLENHMWEAHKKRSCNKCNFLADSLLALDVHIKASHCNQNSQFSCRFCSQTFEARSDMEAHCIFIHNQALQECKENGCDFCTTDPEILDVHKKEVHHSSNISQDTSASRTLCLYCGCEFADSPSLCLHEELFHENPMQKAGRRPLNPYGCCVCGYSTPRQPMMIEHMRVHSGQTLLCQAAGCTFDTPYDTVLREHVLQSHSGDGVVRCPHCGLCCTTRVSFVTHYKALHHPFSCTSCEEVESEHFIVPFSSALNASLRAMYPFAKRVDEPPSGSTDKGLDDGGRRSRKQMQPRKVVVTEDTVVTFGEPEGDLCSRGNTERDRFLSLYITKIRQLAQTPLWKCRLCVRLYFRHKRNYLFHWRWHCLKRYKCHKCIQTYRHRYQVLLHQREHRMS